MWLAIPQHLAFEECRLISVAWVPRRVRDTPIPSEIHPKGKCRVLSSGGSYRNTQGTRCVFSSTLVLSFCSCPRCNAWCLGNARDAKWCRVAGYTIPVKHAAEKPRLTCVFRYVNPLNIMAFALGTYIIWKVFHAHRGVLATEFRRLIPNTE